MPGSGGAGCPPAAVDRVRRYREDAARCESIMSWFAATGCATPRRSAGRRGRGVAPTTIRFQPSFARGRPAPIGRDGCDGVCVVGDARTSRRTGYGRSTTPVRRHGVRVRVPARCEPALTGRGRHAPRGGGRHTAIRAAATRPGAAARPSPRRGPSWSVARGTSSSAAPATRSVLPHARRHTDRPGPRMGAPADDARVATVRAGPCCA
jgi:hypothetical protein